MTWKIDDPQGDEAAKIRWELVEYTNGKGLDLGCGQFKAFPHFIGVDNGHHWGMKGVDVHVDTCEDLSLFAGQSMDFVVSSHLLEHIKDYKKALKEWWRVLKVGGRLCLYLPHKEHYPNIGEKGANPDHKHDFFPTDIESAMKNLGGWDLLRNETRAEGREYSFFQVYRKLGSDKHRYSCNEQKPVKSAAVIRYGAYGDLIQASSVCAGLKAQGFHVTLYTTENGFFVTKHDPNIDKFVVQGKDQVPNPALPVFWDAISKKYDKFVNLSESVEGSLLALQGRTAHGWPKALRHKMLNVNYNEMTHDLAEIPYTFKQKFYPSEEESNWAKSEKKKIGGTVILWSLAGSAVHKTWPHLDAVIARLMIQQKDVKVVLVGDELCKLLEQGWENEPRVICRSGEWTIRQSLAFAQVADIVIGSETGLLNAVGMENVPKVITLSHSTPENLTKHWKNTVAIEPKTDCYPCHRMHYNFEHCKQDEKTGCAQCQADITPEEVYQAISNILIRAA
jgi:ADP-heptose:LPS heptosyltransferase/SAM-dependent methyltransferase